MFKKMAREILEDIWTVPNVLTMVRIALVPVFVIVHQAGHVYTALAIFILASLTDLLDGQIARRSGRVTAFGKLMDPLADKLMVIAALICRTLAGVIPPWFIYLVLAKEGFMVWGGLKVLDRGLVVRSRLLGKMATVAFFVALVLSFFHEELMQAGAPADVWVLYAAGVLMFAALADYVIDTLSQLKKKGML